MAEKLAVIPVVPLDESMALHQAFTEDSHPKKVTLGQGVYRGDDGKPWLLPCVMEAEKRLYEDRNKNHEYLPVEGSTPFLKAASNLTFSNINHEKSSISSVQTVSGTGACHLGALFLNNHLRPSQIFLPDPTWINHPLIFESIAPDVPRLSYPYFSPKGTLDIDRMLAYLETSGREGDVVLLHGCGHNPTGVDPNKEQWKALFSVIQRKRLFPFFDVAYQGFASGDLDEDAWPVRYFHEQLFDSTTPPSPASPSASGMCVAQSFSKSLGLYGERVGAFHLVLPPSTSSSGAFSQLQRLSRAEISSPPTYGAKLATLVLTDPQLREQWKKDLRTMTDRLKKMRATLRAELARAGLNVDDWKILEEQTGMFAFIPKRLLWKDEIDTLRYKHHVYMMKTGRMAMSGLNDGNVRYVAEAIADAIRDPLRSSNGAML